MVKTGMRKFTAFVITMITYSTAAVSACILLKGEPSVLPSLVFQLASAYGLLCGLFFGSNVLEHYSKNRSERNDG